MGSLEGRRVAMISYKIIRKIMQPGIGILLKMMKKYGKSMKMEIKSERRSAPYVWEKT